MKIPIQELEDLCKKALSNYGYSDDESTVILEMLMYAQMRGNDQGIVKLIGAGMPKNKEAKKPTVEKETPTTAIIDANLSMEALAMEEAVNLVIKKAAEMGIAIVGTHRGDGSSGAVGYWSRKVADAGFIGLTMSSYPYGMVPPHGSYEPLFCTNPMAWAVPTNEGPIVLDMSSSGISYYGLIEETTKIANAVKESKKLPGVEEVMVPGERGDRIRQNILDQDEIEIEENLLMSLREFVEGGAS